MVRLDTIFGIDVNTFSAMATAVGVIVALITSGIAIWALQSAAKSSSASLGVDALFRLIDQWGSDAMAKKRAAAAKWRLAKTGVVQTRQAEVDYTNDVLGFFEFVGYLLDENAISLNGVWVNLSDDAVATWYAYKPFIDADQNDDKTLWEDFQKLEGEMEAESERRKVPKSQIVLDDAAIEAFLESEAGLDVTSP
jgi:hypothetical protein